jgi:hypothetical protein
MAKLVVQNDTDPGIAVVLETVPEGEPGRAKGTHGGCTACGRVIHQWREDSAITVAKEHVDNHEPVLIGGDTDALVQ